MSQTAVCSRFTCCGGKIVMNYTKMKIVDVPRGVNSCPDCGGALLWVSDKNKHRRNLSKTPRNKRPVKEYTLNG